ncbi:hypothetical protein BGX31_000711 [Mortierella sp. GBA43]|nr:hypothetical protein BGX31_000711 [Mortierella sp. GBA43]
MEWEKELRDWERAATDKAKEAAKGKGRAKDYGGGGDDGDDGGGDDGGGGGGGGEDDGDDSRVELRTCTSTLKQIMRPDLFQSDGQSTGYERVLALLEQKQKDMTNVEHEIYVLAQKALCVIASGGEYGNQFGANLVSSFDIRRLLPREFGLPEGVDPLVRVSPLPPNLQAHIENCADNVRPKDDWFNVLSQNHLQILHTRFLSSRRGQEDASSPRLDIPSSTHPIWDTISSRIATQSTFIHPPSPDNLGQTINTHIRECSVSIGNQWNGAIYTKSLDYLLRILLRINLAPNREKKIQDLTKNAAKAKKDRVDSKRQANANNMSRKLLRSRSKDLCDELCDVLQIAAPTDRTNRRIRAITTQLMTIQAQMPAPSVFNGQPFLELELEVNRQLAPTTEESAGMSTEQQETIDETVPDYSFLNHTDIDIGTGIVEGLQEEGEEEEEEEGEREGEEGEQEVGGEQGLQEGQAGTVEGNVAKEPPKRRLRALQTILKILGTHLNRYSLLCGDSQNANKPSDKGEDITEQGEVEAKDEDGGPKALRMRRIDTTKALKLPAVYKMTAAQVNDASHTRKLSRQRERRLKRQENAQVRTALQEISSNWQQIGL